MKYCVMFFLMLSAIASAADPKTELTSLVKKVADDEGESLKVYKEIRFGMTLDDIATACREAKEDILQLYPLDAFTKVGEFSFFLDPQFNDEKMIALKFRLSRDSDEYNSTIRAAWKTLADVMTKRYGKPKQARAYPSFIEIDDGVLTHQWVSGPKTIEITLRMENHRPLLSMAIFHTEINRLVKQIADDEKRKAATKSAGDF